MIAAIEWGKLAQVVWVSVLAGVGITALFSLIIYGSGRSAEARRQGAGTAATVYGILAAAAGLAFTVGLIFGVSIILHKS
jgi:hypothetical protein